jgi:hypothetical protein
VRLLLLLPQLIPIGFTELNSSVTLRVRSTNYCFILLIIFAIPLQFPFGNLRNRIRFPVPWSRPTVIIRFDFRYLSSDLFLDFHFSHLCSHLCYAVAVGKVLTMATTACFIIVSRNDIPIYEAEVGVAAKVSSFFCFNLLLVLITLFIFYSLLVVYIYWVFWIVIINLVFTHGSI